MATFERPRRSPPLGRSAALVCFALVFSSSDFDYQTHVRPHPFAGFDA